MSTTNPAEEILAPVHLRGREAAWVLSAHAYALLVPLAFAFAIYYYWDYLSATTYNPFFFFFAALFFAAGAAFEVAQNTMDNWYLTRETASAQGRGLIDLMFYWCITAGQALGAFAIAGDRWWVVLIGVGAMVALPFLYFRDGPYFAPLGMANLLAIGLAFEAFGDPAVFLQLLMVGATMYFFEALLRTGAQSMHGFTTLTASSGVWFLIWAIAGGASGEPLAWLSVVVIAAVSVGAAFATWPFLQRLPATRRVTESGR